MIIAYIKPTVQSSVNRSVVCSRLTVSAAVKTGTSRAFLVFLHAPASRCHNAAPCAAPSAACRPEPGEHRTRSTMAPHVCAPALRSSSRTAEATRGREAPPRLTARPRPHRRQAPHRPTPHEPASHRRPLLVARVWTSRGRARKG